MKSEKNTISPEDGALKKSKQRFLGAIKFLKSTSVRQSDLPGQNSDQSKLFHLPWFLVIGDQHSGKSSLLKNSGLKFLLTKKKQANSGFCDWWGTREAILLDCNSSYFSQDENQPLSPWISFLKLLKSQRTPCLNGIIITLSIEQLSKQNKREQNQHFQNVRQRILDLQKLLKTTLPIYLLFTKADCLVGFNEFFDNLNQQERQQVWGISFNRSRIDTTSHIADTFDVEYDQLLDRLNERVITRLHQEHRSEKCNLIKDFPLQVESLKKQIAYLVKIIAPLCTADQDTPLRGIFFTSSESNGSQVDRLEKPLSNSFALTTEVQSNEVPVFQRAYFIDNLFHQLIFKDPAYFAELPRGWRRLNYIPRPVAAGILVAAISITGWGCFNLFHQQTIKISDAEQALAQYRILAQNLNYQDSQASLPAVNSIDNTLHALQGDSSSQSGEQQREKLIRKAAEAYQQSMEQFLKAQLIAQLNQQLELAGKANANQLYGALKTYLMLGNQAYYNPDFIAKYFTQQWEDTNGTMEKHLNYYLQQPQTPIYLDSNLVSDARSLLKQLPVEDLAFAILTNDLMTENTREKLKLPQQSDFANFFKNDVQNLSFPVICSANYFSHVYDKLIPQTASLLFQGNWVLNTSRGTIKTFSQRRIIDITRKKYTERYIETWQNLLKQLSLHEFSSFEQGILLIDSLAHSHSPISQLLEQIHHNTYVTYGNLQTPISIKFQHLNHYLSQYPQSNLVDMRADLLQLEEQLGTIINGKNINQAAFQLSTKRMQNTDPMDPINQLQQQANNAPEPFASWLNTITENSWQLILAHSKQYINGQWTSTVIPYYSQHINNYYPIAQNSNYEISLGDFNRFFGPDGLMDSFYNTYISPFIDYSAGPWHWKKINNHGLELSQSTLDQFQRGLLIKNLFYPNNQRDPDIKFVFKIISADPKISKIDLSLDDQFGYFTEQSQKPTQYHWPGKLAMHSASMSIKTKDSQNYSDTETGLWSWFRLLDKAVLRISGAPNILEAMFDIQGLGLSSELISTNILNPFSPDLLHHFKCPEQLG